jgi:hypothetical protein
VCYTVVAYAVQKNLRANDAQMTYIEDLMNAFDVFAQLSYLQMALVVVGLLALGRGHPFTALVVFIATCFVPN